MSSVTHSLLRIYLGESDRHGRKPLYRHILEQAQRAGLADCTVTRGIEGFGARRRIHTTAQVESTTDLPVVLETTDRQEKLAAFLEALGPLLDQALVTEQPVVARQREGK